MRTTIEIKPDHRAELAAQRGEKASRR